MHDLIHVIKKNIWNFTKYRKLLLPYEIGKIDRLKNAIEIVENRWPETRIRNNNKEFPVFIFSAGWRSGSTLVQRLVVSSKEIVIWGEPFDDSAIIPVMANTVATITDSWPDSSYFNRYHNLSELKNNWIANISPSVEFLKRSHIEFYRNWLGTSAKKQFCVSRWGLKEVRLTIDHARYLKWLFPNAKFIFVYRNLFYSYRSWKGNRWDSKWPGYYNKSPIIFARHWKTLLKGFLEGYKEVDGILIRFEELINREFNLRKIEDHIKVHSIDENVLSKKLDSYDKRKKKEKVNLSKIDIKILEKIGGKLLKQLNYEPSF